MAPALVLSEPIAEAAASLKNTMAIPAPTPKPHEEFQYLDLIRAILANGEHRPDR